MPERVAPAAAQPGDGTGFLGRRDAEVDLVIAVDRHRQRQAIACHASQSVGNPVLWRRLELSGASESLRRLRPPPGTEAIPEHTIDSPGFDGRA